MEAIERQALLKSLRESREAFVNALDGVPEEEAVRKPEAGGWSMLECAEHVAIAERLMLRLIRHGSPITEPAADDRSREERIRRGATDRSRKGVTPDSAAPRGRFSSVVEAVDHFNASRDHAIGYVESCPEDLRRLSTVHPIAGRITCMECLLLLIAHPARHALQIREILETFRDKEH